MNNLVDWIFIEENGVYVVGSMLKYNFSREIVWWSLLVYLLFFKGVW